MVPICNNSLQPLSPPGNPALISRKTLTQASAMILAPFPVVRILCIIIFFSLPVPSRVFAASKAAGFGEAPSNVQRHFYNLERRIQALQQRHVLIAGNDVVSLKDSQSTDQCPRKLKTYLSKLGTLQNKEKEKRNEIKRLNDKLAEIKLGMYTRIANQQMSCLETTAEELSSIEKAASQLGTNSLLREAEHLLICIDNSMKKITAKIDKARASSNTMEVAALDSVRGQLANFRSIATDLSQQYSVHENKRKRLEKDAGEKAKNCAGSNDVLL